MKYFGILITTLVLLGAATSPTKALYDPRTLPLNKVGVHVLDPSEVEAAASLVNSEGGDWGYIIVPIQPTDRDQIKWQTFMERCRSLHVIPIIRITTIPQGGTWASGADTDLVDFANFLNELAWPVENRYIVLFNEVNRSAEWGGTVNPEKYASIVKNARTIFKERSEDFFLLGPALDDALPDSTSSMSAKKYLQLMAVVDPSIWSYFDGWAAHSYPNPGFVGSPKQTGPTSIVSYQVLVKQPKLAAKPVFITETGWDQEKVARPTLISYWSQAWSIWNADPNVVAVTPFLLRGGEQFRPFSLISDEGGLTTSGEAIKNLPKSTGAPRPGSKSTLSSNNLAHQSVGLTLPWFRTAGALLKLENIFRVILGLPEKATISLADQSLLVELARTPAQWEKGLGDRSSLDNVDGMLFIFPYKHIPVFWMKDTHFSLDMIWLSDNVVVDITRNVPVAQGDKLPTYSPVEPANAILEVPSGWSDAYGIKIGDTLTL